MSPIKPNGKATRSSGLHAIPPSQDVSRYQATNRPDIWGPINPPISWSRAAGIVVAIVVPVACFLAWLITEYAR